MADDAQVKWFEVPCGDELWEGDFLDLEVAGEQVLLVHHLGGEFRAFQGVCPHQEILLADGAWDEDTGVLRCSGHNWEFDLRTGAGINPAGCRLFEYAVRPVEDGVEIGIPQDGGTHYNRFAGT
jgi:toluene monooxygenase system ferredoxin subunit